MGRSRSWVWRRYRDERGFTMQEMIVTLIIVGVLAAIAIVIFLALLERWRVEAATNQLVADLRLAHTHSSNELTDWRVVLMPNKAEEDQGADYYLVKLAAPYPATAAAIAPDTPTKPRYFPGNVRVMNMSGSLDIDTGWRVDPSQAGVTRTIEFNSDGTMKFYQAVSGSTCVTVDTNPENRVIVLAATSRVKVVPDDCGLPPPE